MITMKKTTLLLTVLFLLPSLSYARKEETPTQDTLKVMSYNIRMGEADDGTNSWNFRFPATGLMLKDQQPDLFGLQEAFGYQVRFIQENFKNYGSYGIGRENGRKQGEHMTIFYNKKVLKMGKKGTFWLSEHPEKPSTGWDAACKRTATWAIFTHKASKRKFIYVNTHLDHVGQTAREEGLKLILQKIDELNKDQLPVILTGDFNVTPDNACLDVLDGRMLSARDTAGKTDHEGTFNDWGRADEIIDYIYYSGFSSCPVYETVTRRYDEWKYVSDHYPITATLIF